MASESGALVLLEGFIPLVLQEGFILLVLLVFLVLQEGFILLQAKVTSFLPPCLDQWKQIQATQCCSIQTSTPVLASSLITIFTAFAKIMLLFLHMRNKCKKCGWCILTPRPFQPACLLRSLVQACIGQPAVRLCSYNVRIMQPHVNQHDSLPLTPVPPGYF